MRSKMVEIRPWERASANEAGTAATIVSTSDAVVMYSELSSAVPSSNRFHTFVKWSTPAEKPGMNGSARVSRFVLNDEMSNQYSGRTIVSEYRTTATYDAITPGVKRVARPRRRRLAATGA